MYFSEQLVEMIVLEPCLIKSSICVFDDISYQNAPIFSNMGLLMTLRSIVVSRLLGNPLGFTSCTLPFWFTEVIGSTDLGHVCSVSEPLV